MNITESLTAQKLYEIAKFVRNKGESIDDISVFELIEEIKRQVSLHCTNHNENAGA